MTRRQAVQNILWVSAGIALIPSCQAAETGPIYANVPLESGQRTFIDLMTNAILPRAGTAIKTPESTTDFILTMLNDCASPVDVKNYIVGIKEFRQGIKEQYQTTFKDLSVEKQLEVFTQLGQSPKMTEAAKHFFNTTKGLSQRHFTTSEFFMKNKRDFEFAPGRYVGCSPI